MKNHFTLNVRVFLVTLCIAIPTVLSIAFISVQNRTMFIGENLSQSQSEVDIAVSQLDMVLDVLANSAVNYCLDDSDFQLVANAEEETTEFWMANRRLMQKMLNLQNVSSLKVTFFTYFPANDTFYNSESDPEMTEEIKKLIAGKEEVSLQKGWNTVWCSDEAYLLYMLDYSSYYVGIWGKYDNFYSWISKAEDAAGTEYWFTDTEGNILDSTGRGIDLSRSTYRDESGTEWYVVYAAGTAADFSLIKLLGKNSLESEFSKPSVNVTLTIIIFVVLYVVFVFCIYRWVLIPMKNICSSMEKIQSSSTKHRISATKGSSVEFETVVNEFNELMDYMENLKIEMYESQLEQNEIKLMHLSQQIQPHFMLNTLNTLYNYSDSDVGVAKEIIRLTSGYYRYVVNVNSKYVELGQELEHIDHYLRLQKIRYPHAISFEVRCEETLKSTPVPPFLIESFVGNSIKHGIRPGKMMLLLIQVVKTSESAICIQISDTGDGYSEDSLDAIEEFLSDGTISEELGMGIRNSVERLRLIYHDNYQIRFYNQEPHGAVTEIHIRLRGEENEDTGIDRG